MLLRTVTPPGCGRHPVREWHQHNAVLAAQEAVGTIQVHAMTAAG